MSSDRFPSPTDFFGPPSGLPPPGGPAPDAAGRRKPRRKTLLLVLLIVGLCLFGGIALIVGIGALYVFTATEEELTVADRGRIVDVEMLAEMIEGGYTPDPACEKIVRLRYLDRAYEVDYEYDDPDDPNAPYLNCCLTVEPKHGDALTSYVTSWQAARLGMAWGADVEVEIVERNDLFSWGDQSRFAIIHADGQPSGNLFVARKGKAVFYLILGGVYFDDGEAFGELVRPALSNVASLRP